MAETDTSIVETSWSDSIAEGNRAGIADKYTSLDAFAAGHKELASMMGTAVQIPNDETTPEKRTTYKDTNQTEFRQIPIKLERSWQRTRNA